MVPRCRALAVGTIAAARYCTLPAASSWHVAWSEMPPKRRCAAAPGLRYAHALDNAMLGEQVCEASIQQSQRSADSGVQNQRLLAAPLSGVVCRGVRVGVGRRAWRALALTRP